MTTKLMKFSEFLLQSTTLHCISLEMIIWYNLP